MSSINHTLVLHEEKRQGEDRNSTLMCVHVPVFLHALCLGLMSHSILRLSYVCVCVIGSPELQVISIILYKLVRDNSRRLI